MANRQVDFTIRKVGGEVPEPHSSKHGRYQDVIDAVVQDGVGRGLDCADRKDGQAVYAGIMRAVERSQHEFEVQYRTNKDQTVTIFVTPLNTTSKEEANT